MSRIDFNSFMNFCRGLQGRTLATVGGRAEFTLTSVQPDSLDYHVLSTGKDRGTSRKWIVRLLERYEETKSLHPKDYLGITMNASYTLALLELYLNRDR